MRKLTCFTNFLLFFCTSLFSQKALAQKENNTIVLEFALKSGSSIVFNYWDDMNQIQRLEVANPSKQDTLITRSYTLKRPTHFTHGLMIQSPVTKKYLISSDDYLLLPGDTLRLAGEGINVTMISYSGGAAQLNQLFWMPKDDNFEFQQYSEYKKNGLSGGYDFSNPNILQRFKDSSKRSLALIETLYRQRQLSKKYYEALKKFSLLNEFNNIAIYSSIYSDLNEHYKEMYRAIDRWSGISSRMNNNVLEFVFKQLAATQNSTTDKWYTFTLLPATLKTKLPIQHYLLYKVQGDKDINSDRETLKANLDKLSKAGFNNPFLEAYYQGYIQSQNLKNNTVATLVDSKGDSLNLNSIMTSLKGKYVFVDIWASWCVPCLEQMPYLQKVKQELADENIVFLALSADIENQHEAWLTMSKKQVLDKELYNYRFKQGFDNTYLQSNQITSVPTYLLFNPKGEIVNIKLPLPRSPQFKEALLAHIKKQ